MIIDILPSHPYSLESAQALSSLLLEGAHDIPPQTQDVLAALLTYIVNTRPEDPQWLWEEIDDAITAALDCGESEGQPVNVFLDAWFDYLRSPGLEAAVAAFDGSPYSFGIATEVRAAIRVVALPSIRLMCSQMEV